MTAAKDPKQKTDLTLIGDEHVRRYRETKGEEGYIWNGATCLVLTARGRTSGAERDVPLICGFDGARSVVVASKGGAPEHPAWYHNLVAEPHCRVQVRAECFDAVARTVEGPERERLWRLMAEVWPSYDEYAKRTERKIPVVVLERVG
jgi:deazaflavin-dependent oxidoreductase (nitroreductase family)